MIDKTMPDMKSIINFLHAPSSIYKSMTKGEVILTHIVCILMCLVVGMAENHPVAALIIAALIGCIVFLTKTAPNESDQ